MLEEYLTNYMQELGVRGDAFRKLPPEDNPQFALSFNDEVVCAISEDQSEQHDFIFTCALSAEDETDLTGHFARCAASLEDSPLCGRCRLYIDAEQAAVGLIFRLATAGLEQSRFNAVVDLLAATVPVIAGSAEDEGPELPDFGDRAESEALYRELLTPLDLTPEAVEDNLGRLELGDNFAVLMEYRPEAQVVRLGNALRQELPAEALCRLLNVNLVLPEGVELTLEGDVLWARQSLRLEEHPDLRRALLDQQDFLALMQERLDAGAADPARGPETPAVLMPV